MDIQLWIQKPHRFIVVELVMLLAGDKAAALTGLRVGLRKGRNTDLGEKIVIH